MPSPDLLRAPSRHRPFPRIPHELVEHVVRQGARTVALVPFAPDGDEHAQSRDAADWLRTCCLVSRDWLAIAQPLLLAHVSLSSIPSCRLFLTALRSPSPTVLGRPAKSLVRTFTYGAWSPALADGSAAAVDYGEVMALRAALLELLLAQDAVEKIAFPTVTLALLHEFAAKEAAARAAAAGEGEGGQGASRLRTLGTVLAVENKSLSEVFESPVFASLEELSIWYGDPATGALAFPNTLKTLNVRCDHFDQGNNLILPELPAPSYTSSAEWSSALAGRLEAEKPQQQQHLPNLRHLSFDFTTKHYPEASPWTDRPLLLDAVGRSLTSLAFAADRATDPARQTLDVRALACCPALEVLALRNFRIVTAAAEDGEGEMRVDDRQGSGKWAGIAHKTVREIQYRLDTARPFALPPPLPFPPAAEGAPADVAASRPVVVDALALDELNTLFTTPALRARWPALTRLAIGNLPFARRIKEDAHVRQRLAWLCALPERCAAAGVHPVEVTDAFGRPLSAVLHRILHPHPARALEKLPLSFAVRLPSPGVPGSRSMPARPRPAGLAAGGQGALEHALFASSLADGRDESVSPASSAGVHTPADALTLTPGAAGAGSSGPGGFVVGRGGGYFGYASPNGSRFKVHNEVELGAVLMADSADEDDA